MKKIVLKQFDGVDYTLRVYEDGFTLEVVNPNAAHCGDTETFEHWEEDEDEDNSVTPAELHAMAMAGMFGNVK